MRPVILKEGRLISIKLMLGVFNGLFKHSTAPCTPTVIYNFTLPRFRILFNFLWAIFLFTYFTSPVPRWHVSTFISKYFISARLGPKLSFKEPKLPKQKSVFKSSFSPISLFNIEFGKYIFTIFVILEMFVLGSGFMDEPRLKSEF